MGSSRLPCTVSSIVRGQAETFFGAGSPEVADEAYTGLPRPCSVSTLTFVCVDRMYLHYGLFFWPFFSGGSSHPQGVWRTWGIATIFGSVSVSRGRCRCPRW